MSTAVRYDDATLADIQRRFREGRPSETAKRRRHSRCTLIASLRTEIEQFLSEGYSLEGISEYFARLDVNIPPATLKNYLGRARRTPSGTAALPSRNIRRNAQPDAETRPRKTLQTANGARGKSPAPSPQRESTNKDPTGETVRETAREAENTTRSATAQVAGTHADGVQSASDDIERPPAERDVHREGAATSIAAEAPAGMSDSLPSTTPSPEAEHGAAGAEAATARGEHDDGDGLALSLAPVVNAPPMPASPPAAHAPTPSAQGAARPIARALSMGNIGFVPRR